MTTTAASGSSSLTLTGTTFSYTPPVIPTIPTYTITTAGTASGGGALSLNGTTFTFTPAVTTPTFSAQSANVVLAGPSTGANATPTFRQLVSADLPTATTSTAGTVIVPAVATSGITNTSGTIGIATASTTQLGGVIVDGTTVTISNGVISSAGAGGTLRSRTTVATTTSSLANGASATATVTAAKGYALYSIQVSRGAWVTVYTSSAAQSSDSSRSITTDPTPGSGVVAEAITTTATTTYFTPAIFGFNADGTVGTNMYLKIYNNSGSTGTVTVTVTYLQLEA